MTIIFEMKDIEQIIVINFEENYDEKEITEQINSFYEEWLNYEEYADEEEWAEIENMSAERWIIDHLNDYEYIVADWEIRNRI